MFFRMSILWISSLIAENTMPSLITTTSTPVVSLEKVKEHLRLEADDVSQDSYLMGLIGAADEFFARSCWIDGDYVPETLPPLLSQGILLLVGHYFENREAATDRTITTIPIAIQSIVELFSKRSIL